MLPIRWQDRESHKQHLSNWLSSATPAFALSVSDSQELDDIDEWLREKFEDGLVAHATFASDTEILRYALLEMIVFGLGEDKFNEFIKVTQSAPTLSPVTITQSLGDGAKSKDEVEYEKNTQKVDIHLDSNLLQKQNYFEKNIFPILGAFIKDIQKLAKKGSILLVIKFKKIGIEGLNSDFFIWLQEHFLYKLGQIQNLKICVISQGNIDKFTKITDEQKIYVNMLSLKDVLEATIEHLDQYQEFCYGVIDPDNETVEYKVFKRKLYTRINRLRQERQNA